MNNDSEKLLKTTYYLDKFKVDLNKLKKQLEEGLKILAPLQMLTRLPNLLAKVKAGNNSQKLKNEIRRLLYSLYRSKKIHKSVYERLIDVI